ncbi:hypothetical protein [uncultured Aquitalea sp.]|uniref:hypothetical protein n=1 Tax=uncultured Aquitalea sp. TaxID=540272 RepID=UPI0025D2A564|nr:hypothetical protein [uncultured Aquitalea sp.]
MALIFKHLSRHRQRDLIPDELVARDRAALLEARLDPVVAVRRSLWRRLAAAFARMRGKAVVRKPPLSVTMANDSGKEG